MAAPTYSVPVANGDASTEEPKIISALAEIKDILAGGVDEDNVDPNGDIPLTALATQTAGRLIIANASGVIVPAAASGVVTMDSAGAFSLVNNSVGNSQLQDNAVGNAELQDNAVNTSEITDAAVTRVKLSATLTSELNSYATAVGTIPTLRKTNVATGILAAGTSLTVSLSFTPAYALDLDPYYNVYGAYLSLASTQIRVFANVDQASMARGGFDVNIRNDSSGSANVRVSALVY